MSPPQQKQHWRYPRHANYGVAGGKAAPWSACGLRSLSSSRAECYIPKVMCARSETATPKRNGRTGQCATAAGRTPTGGDHSRRRNHMYTRKGGRTVHM
eukprot:768549-Amphidinium_carterae.1